MRYIISCENPHRHFIQIEYIVPVATTDILSLQLPAWRPGRYTLQNFAKNIRAFAVYDEKGNALQFEKTSKDCWQVNTRGAKHVHVKYEYYANVLDAGSAFLDEQQLYVNPVNCLLYVPGREGEKCEVEVRVPKNYKVASPLTSASGGRGEQMPIILEAKDYHVLVDSPFIASQTLKHYAFTVPSAPLSLGEGQGGEALVKFHLWFQGESKPDFEKIENHFRKFIAAQLKVFGEFPFSEYHFLFQIAPFQLYHGVEHQNSTVIALGPSYDLMKEQLYNEFLGISSHELFHAWNVKAIRPAEMQPYDYSKENYSKLGYVAEGVTTYYGDLMLFRSGAVSEYEFNRNLHLLLQKHFHNYGRFNLSVGASSVDTWLDGYEKGIPHRKVSIYNEGALCALMLDLLIRKQTGNDFSMDDVLRKLYNDFGKKGIGYTEEDYRKALETVAGTSFADFFAKYYNGTESYEPLLRETFAYVGLEIKDSRSKYYYENRFGFKAENKRSGALMITEVAPNSIADKAGLSEGDELVAVNGIKLLNNLKEWLKYFQEETVRLTVLRASESKEVALTPATERYYRTYWPAKMRDASDAQKENYKKWTGREW
jgi:predicted metalloprotease with PDZ domain